jgi:hypothetical protein
MASCSSGMVEERVQLPKNGFKSVISTRDVGMLQFFAEFQI